MEEPIRCGRTVDAGRHYGVIRAAIVRACSRVKRVPGHISVQHISYYWLAGAMPPVPPVPTITRISAKMKCVQEHNSVLNVPDQHTFTEFPYYVVL